MSNLGVWDLIMASRFEEACARADAEYASKHDVLALFDKVLALLNLERYEDVLQLIRFLMEQGYADSDGEYISAGIALWFLGRRAEAVDMWRESKETRYTDAAGGVLVPLYLLFAAVKMDDSALEKEAIRWLKRRTKSKRMVNWPGPLADYALGRISEEQLLAMIAEQPLLRARQTCQAFFHIAVGRLKAGDEQGYYENLRQCVNQEPVSRLESEYYLAGGELSQRSAQA